ncbi:hypothetical protein GCM10022221_74490 [Actinocorallia aurea]
MRRYTAGTYPECPRIFLRKGGFAIGAHTRNRQGRLLLKIAVPVGAVAVIGLAAAVNADDSDKNLSISPERPPAATASTTVTPTSTPRGQHTPVSAPTTATPTATPTSAIPSPRPTTPKPQPTQAPTTQAPSAPTARPVPDVVGLSLEEAAVRLAAAGFGYQEVCVRGRDRGVVQQQPAAGAQWQVGGEVSLVVADRRCDDDHDDDGWRLLD